MKRFVRKGVPNEHRAKIWMAASGAQERLEKNRGYYQSLLAVEHDPKLRETIHIGESTGNVMALRWSSFGARDCAVVAGTDCYQDLVF